MVFFHLSHLNISENIIKLDYTWSRNPRWADAKLSSIHRNWELKNATNSTSFAKTVVCWCFPLKVWYLMEKHEPITDQKVKYLLRMMNHGHVFVQPASTSQPPAHFTSPVAKTFMAQLLSQQYGVAGKPLGENLIRLAHLAESLRCLALEHRPNWLWW